MKTPLTARAGSHRTNLNSLTRIAALIALVALMGIPLFSTSSASSIKQILGKSRASSPSPVRSKALDSDPSGIASRHLFSSSKAFTRFPFVIPSASALAETIETFAADCDTARTQFYLGETVCAKTTGVTATDRFVNWLAPPSSTVAFSSPTITQDPETFLYTPTVVGLWKATIADPTDSSINPTIFEVVQQTAPLATYAPDCVTPKSTFNLDDMVCVRAIGFGGSNNRLAWIDPANLVRTFTPIISDPQTDTFMLPSTETSVVDIFVVDNRGTWKVNVLSGDGRQLASVPFTVQGTSAAADLSLGKSLNGSAPDAAQPVSFGLTLTNFGPNTASNVSISDPLPANATFVSITQTSGPTFTCTGSNPVVCEPDNAQKTLAARATASFELTYTAGAANSEIINVASVTSDTTELNAADNTAIARVTVGGGGAPPPTCTLDCPADITVATNTAGGANVTFGSPDQFGDCGAVTTNHASGSFFAIGTTIVTATSATGGGTCSFAVTVIDAPNPTISCPPDQTVAAASGQTEATVSVGSPTVTGSGVTVKGLRSDSQHIDDPPSDFPGLTDPYPVGTTLITWTATDQFGRSASCIQKIIVTSQDAPTISCPSDKTFTAASGECTFTATAAQIGTPTTTGPGVTVTKERSDNQALTDPYPAGQTFITWTATNSVGSASCTQTITVNATDTQAPTLVVPANINTTTSSCSVLLDDELGVATATDNCTASVNITRTGVPRVPCPIPGDPGRTCESFVFPTGTTTITYTAMDAAGNTTIGYQLVTVTEDPAVPPTIDAPADVTLYTGLNATSCSVTVSNLDATLGTATANDNCPGVTVARSNVPAGNVFPLGPTTITYTATDKSGNMASDNQVVTVVDNTKPVVTPPGPVTLYTGPGATSCGVTVSDLNGTFGTGSATDNCPGVGAVTRSGVPSGNVFPVGNTTLTYSATDANGNTGSATQTVTVVDNTPPTISCQANIIADFDAGVGGATVTYTAPVGSDNCPGQTTSQIAGLASGATLPLGTTTNTFKVTDAAGNTAQCSFKVTVALTSIVGVDSVSITGNALVDSYDSTVGYPASKGSLANVLSNGTITVAGSSKVFGNVRSTRAGVVVSGTSQVTGNATAGTTVSKGASAIIGGTITNNALAPVMTLPPVPVCGPPYSSNSGITGTYSYNASTGDLTLSGINSATLANGNYCFHNVTLTNSGQLKVNGPVVIKLTGTLNTSGATSLPNTTLIPSNLQILSSYSGSNGVTLGNSSSLQLVVYAPNTNVSITGSAPLFGTVAGKTITVSNSGMIHYDTKLKTIWPNLWTLILGP